MSASRERQNFVNRSPRVAGRPDHEPGFVRYFASKNQGLAAHFADISETGMRLVSRHPIQSKVGDFLELEYTLPGTETRLKDAAVVVRRVNDFVFAVRFIGDRRELRAAMIDKHVAHLNMSTIRRVFRRTSAWAIENQRGLWIAMIGSALTLGAVLAVYLSSDQYHRRLRPWGLEYPGPKPILTSDTAER